MTEVGVSLALRRHRSLIGSEDDGRTKTKNDNNNIKPDSEKRKRRLRSPSPRFSKQHVGDNIVSQNSENDRGIVKTEQSKRSTTILEGPSYSSWRIFFEGAALYIFCMVLPTILGIIVRLYQTFWMEGGIVPYQIIGHICSKSWLVESQICRKYLPESMLLNFNDGVSSTNSSVLAPDAGLSDVAIIIFLSLTIAITRIALVHFLVPNYKQPNRLKALVRCKSIHLLSSASAYSGSVTPTTEKMRMNSDYYGYDAQSANSCDDADIGDGSDEDTDGNNIEIRPMFPSGSLSHLGRKNNNANQDKGTEKNQNSNEWLFHHDDDQGTTNNWLPEEENTINNNDAPAVSSGLLTRNSAQNLQALLEQASPSASTIVQQKGESGPTSLTKKETTGERIYAAPKYATAVFRLIFCLVSCLIGRCYFGSADFWPPALGGTGNTRNCWDLSSVGVTNIVDSDFDSSNTVLRRYYLIQASYHVHSAAFHILTSILLWFVSKSSKNKESSTPRFLGFIPMGMFKLYNVQIFFQHIFSLVLIFGTFLFSSTRRLGAIAMFAFDASSLFLHLLQLGINAPQHKLQKQQQKQQYKEKSERKIGWYPRRKSLILILHRFLVIPAFCYARFYVFPFVVCYSALEESQDWLHQLENMLIPGTAKFIHGFFVIAFLLLMLMNLIYFRRLLNHPHVTYTLQQQIRDCGKK